MIIAWGWRKEAKSSKRLYQWRQEQVGNLLVKINKKPSIPTGGGGGFNPAPQQTRIFGNAKTEVMIAEWLEQQWSPLGDDITDMENSRQIAARIRRGEYLNELVSTERRDLCRDAG